MTEFIKGRKYKVIARENEHQFKIGETVTCTGGDSFENSVDYWHLAADEVELIAEKKQAPKIVGREYIVIAGGEYYLEGKVVKLVEDDGTDSPLFEVVDSGKTHYIFLTAVLLLADVEAETAVTEEQEAVEPVKAKHKYAVGDKFTVINKDAMWTRFSEGTEITVTFLSEDLLNVIPKYRAVDANWDEQWLLETQLKPVEPVELKAGEFYYSEIDFGDGNAEPAVIQYGAGLVQNVLFTKTGEYFTAGYVSQARKWQPATEAQKSQFLAAKLAEGIATETDKKLYASLLPMDNPELEVGEVYYRKDGAIIRAEQGDTVTTGLTGNYLWETLFVEKSVPGVSAHLPSGHRKALPFEVALLEQKELENDAVYVKPLVNDRGTVIEVGQYYSTEKWGTVAKVLGIKDGMFAESRYEGGLIKYCSPVPPSSPYGKGLRIATPTEIELFKAVEKVEQLKEELGVK